MPILYSFYNHGDVRLAVTDDEVLESWKEFFNTGTNWKDLVTDMSYSDYKKMKDILNYRTMEYYRRRYALSAHSFRCTEF